MFTGSFATCSYARFTPDAGVPVRIGYGGVPAGLPYTVRFNLGELAAPLDTMRLAHPDATRAYRRQLESIGADTIARDLDGVRRLARPEEGVPLVFLTAADLSREGLWCHRTMLAAWLTEHGAGLVPELDRAVGAAADGTPAMF